MSISPVYLAGKNGSNNHAERKIDDHHEMLNDLDFKEKNGIDFAEYFKENFQDMYSFSPASSNMIHDVDFSTIDGLDDAISKLIQSQLKEVGILNEHNFISMDTLSYDSLFESIDKVVLMTDSEKDQIFEFLEDIQSTRASDFESFSKTIFELDSTNEAFSDFNISPSESAAIFDSLVSQGVLNNYGVLLMDPDSDGVESAVNNIPGISEAQQKRVLSLLQRHPELSYSSYVANVGSTEIALSKEEFDYLKIVGALEWSMISSTLNRAYKSSKKKIEKQKAEKKKDAQENAAFLAKIEAQNKKRMNQRKKS